ncbi:putative RNA polymerase II subunit B1 CTD phosphatase RPAP2 homolog isoform X1 [Coffea eugenioides]|uniref:putative RNA polymerase II subunit B1 CTD phosphatase RPAP2 homolog isoform X1 n=1 Tax=Coffea eugenioides TaxID=49369 RepID=UPI000F6119C8|nr:putative RNA polymerase II subunit B1 CTD phosphatase RPAP2 homolog isoform X1 [Coffea eugenioides]
MAKDHVIAVKDAVHRLQLSLLEGIQDENKLFAAGSVMSQSDYQDVVTERSITNLCGYPLCGNSLPLERPRKGRYRISLKEHKVYDLHETYMYCSTNCVVNSRAFVASLQEERSSTLNPVKLNEILRLFEGLSLEESSGGFGKNSDLELSKLRIQEMTDTGSGEVSLEEWIGPSNAIEGYVPLKDSCSNIQQARNLEKGCKSEHAHIQQIKDNFFNDVDFTSTLIIQDEYSMSKSPDPARSISGHKTDKQKGKMKHKDMKDDESTELEGRVVSEGNKIEKKNLDKAPRKPAIKDNLGDSLGDLSNDIDEKLVISDSFSGPGRNDLNKNMSEAASEFQAEKASSSTANMLKPSLKSTKGKRGTRSVTWADEKVDGNGSKSLCDLSNDIDEKLVISDSFSGPGGNDLNKNTSEAASEFQAEKASSSTANMLKPSLKSTKGKGGTRSVTWADEKVDGNGSKSLCEFRELEDTKNIFSQPGSAVMEVNEDPYRFASAEVCARALSEAAEAVVSGDADTSDAVAEAGIILLPPHPEVHGTEAQVEVDMPDSETNVLKWPMKSGLSNSDLLDPNDSWYDTPPEGFSLNLSPFATMFMALFGWISSSSLAYIYGHDESLHEDYLYINGREYPRKIFSTDGRSLEIKQALAGCLARALPALVADLQLPMPLSTLEKEMDHLLDTMSFMDPLPPFRMKQWQLLVLLLLDALSVYRIPALTPYMTGRRILLPKVLQGAQISAEEYEIMKDLIIPLGRVPQFAMQCGA